MTTLGRALISHNRLTQIVHRLVHRKRDEACFICAAVWSFIGNQPGFREAIEQGEQDVEAGRWYRFDTTTGETHPNPDWPNDGPQPTHQ